MNRKSALSLLIILSAAPWQAIAAIRCIENESQFQASMDSALASTDTVEEVRIKAGLYTFTSGSTGYFGVLQGSGKSLTIRGGWMGASGSCSVQGGNTTILNGANQRPVLAINASSTFTGSITIENLTIVGGLTSSGSSASALGLAQQNGGVMGILLDRVWIESNTTQAGLSASTLQLISDSGLVMRNCLIANNNSGAAPAITAVVRAGQSNLMLNNTIAKNTSAQSSGYVGVTVSAREGASMVLANNLFDGNIATASSRRDIRIVDGSSVSLQNNRYTGIFGPITSETGSSTGPAGFLGNGYDLSPSSTARDTGAAFTPLFQGALDVAGTPRVQGSAVDLGALEFSFQFRNGFE